MPTKQDTTEKGFFKTLFTPIFSNGPQIMMQKHGGVALHFTINKKG
jgi:hypothetical protein